jgi:hypothetical protein
MARDGPPTVCGPVNRRHGDNFEITGTFTARPASDLSEDAMALDASRVLGSSQLAATKVWHRGTAWRNTVRVNYSADAVLLAPFVAWMLYGARPDLAPAQTPRLGGMAALLAVTKDELVLVALRRKTPAQVIARVPLGEVRDFDLDRARGVWPLTITFGDGETWRLEVPRSNKKAASAVAAVVRGQGRLSYPGAGPGDGLRRGARYRARNILAVAGAVVVAGIAIGALSLRGHGAPAPPGRSPAATRAARPAAARQQAPARIGTSFDVHDGSGNTYQVTLVKVIDPARGAGPFNTPDRGTRLVAAVFRITAVTGSPKNEDAIDDAKLVASNGQTYLYSFDDIVGYTDFSNGVIKVAQGGTTTGAVSFQVPDGVQVTDIRWTAADGFGAKVQWASGS